jgi:hypothetical protein
VKVTNENGPFDAEIFSKHLVATTTTSASGSYAFRFTAPGSYTVQVGPPPGYAAQPPVTLDIKMFDEVRVDFSLSAP